MQACSLQSQKSCPGCKQLLSRKPGSQVRQIDHSLGLVDWLTALNIAFQALFLIADMQPGNRVLIHAGASGVGIAANQLAKGFGAKQVFTTAG